MIDETLGDLPASAMHVEANGATVINLAALCDLSPFLLREFFIAVWKQHGWPLQQFGYREWDALCEMALSQAPPKLTLPGGMLAELLDGRLLLIRCVVKDA